MIETDYEFKRIEGNKEHIYKPNEKIRSINNISYIKAPNSSGKSTYLNLIGLIFWAYKDDAIDPDLKKKIAGLLESENQKISFNMNISNRQGDIQIIAKKGDFEGNTFSIEEIRNGHREILTPVNIKNKYKIIYDIPRNPVTRLKQLTDEVKEEQNTIGNRISQVRIKIQQILQEIQDSKDPEYIATLEKKLSHLEDDEETKSQLRGKIEKEEISIEKYYYYRFYNEYKQKLDELKRRKDNIQKGTKREIRKRKYDNTEYYEAYGLAKDEIDRIKAIKRELTNDLSKIIPDKKGLLKVWDGIDLERALEEYKISDTFIDCIVEIDRILCEKLNEKKNDKNIQEAEVYRQLMSALEKYVHLDIKMDFVNMNIRDFYNDIRKTYLNKQSKLSDLDLVSEASRRINDIDTSKRRLQDQYLPILRKTRANVSPDEISSTKQDKADQEIEKLDDEIVKVNEKYLKFQANYEIHERPSEADIKESLGNEIHTFDKIREEKIKERLDLLHKEVLENKTEITDIGRRIKNLRDEINQLKNKKEHPYKKHQGLLEKIGEKIKRMDYQINNNYCEYLKQIKLGKILSPMNKDQEKYNEEIFSYLGKRMGRIPIHTGEIIEVKKVDLFKSVLETSDGGKYYLDQMGTGQTQAAYLQSLLSTEDDRMIIAMFDEVGSMGENTLMLIKKKMKELYVKNKMLLGLIVQQRDEGFEITNLEREI